MKTLDVQALYTNILHNDAQLYLEEVLNTRENIQSPTHFPLFIFLIDTILGEKLDVEKISTKKPGGFYGSTFAPSTTNIFMASLEKNYNK